MLLVVLLAADKPEQDEFEKYLKMLDNDYYKSEESREACQYFCKLLDGKEEEAVKNKLLSAVDRPGISDRQRFGIYKILGEYVRLTRYHYYDFFELAIQFESDMFFGELFVKTGGFRLDPLLDPLIMEGFERYKNVEKQTYPKGNDDIVNYIVLLDCIRYVRDPDLFDRQFIDTLMETYQSCKDSKYCERGRYYAAMVRVADRDERAWQIVKSEMERILKEGDQEAFDRLIWPLKGGSCVRALTLLDPDTREFQLFPDHRVLPYLLKMYIAKDPNAGVYRILDAIMSGWLGTDLRTQLEWYRENADYLRNIEYKNPHFVVADFEKMVSEINRRNYKIKIDEISKMFNYRREIKIPGSKVFKYVRNDLMEWWRTNGRLHMWDNYLGKYFVFDIAYDIGQLCAMSPGDARDKAVEAFFKQFEGSMFRVYPIDQAQAASDPRILEKWWQGVNQDYLYVDRWYDDDGYWSFDHEKFPPRVFCDVHAYKNKIPAAIWQKIPWKARDSWKTLSEDERKQHIDKINADNAAEKALTEQARAHKIAVCIWRHINEKARDKWDKLSAEEREKHLCAAEEILLNPPFEVRIVESKTEDTKPDKTPQPEDKSENNPE